MLQVIMLRTLSSHCVHNFTKKSCKSSYRGRRFSCKFVEATLWNCVDATLWNIVGTKLCNCVGTTLWNWLCNCAGLMSDISCTSI